MTEQIIKECDNKIKESLKNLEENLRGLSIRASTSMLNPIKVSVYGNNTPLQHVANISVTGEATISIQVWDRSLTKEVEVALINSNLGSVTSGDSVINLTLPAPSLERRKTLNKLAKDYSENAKIAIKQIRQNIINALKKQNLSEDEEKRLIAKIEQLKDNSHKTIADLLVKKEKELLGN